MVKVNRPQVGKKLTKKLVHQLGLAEDLTMHLVRLLKSH